jgi:cytoskeletal protein RodZ
MEELKKDDLGDASAATEAGGEPGEGRRFRLSKRTLILGGAGLLILVLIVSGVFAYRASVKQKEVAQAQAEVKKRELALREEAAKREAEEARARAEAGRKAHEEIMAASPPAASLPPPLKESAASAGLPAVAGSESSKLAVPVTAEKAAPAAAASTEKTPALPESNKTEAKPAQEVAEPGAAGGCTLSGGSPGDYGKALGRCLEEFNRLEGRKN